MLPILLGVLALVVDFGRMGYDRTIVANAANLAAQAGSLEPAGEDLTDWQNKVRDAAERELAQLPQFDAANLGLVAELTESAGLSCVRVELRYPYPLFFNWPMLGSEVAITQIVVVPRERGRR